MVEERLDEYIKRIYGFCDNNVGESVLSTEFKHLWPIPEQDDSREYSSKNAGIFPLKKETVSSKDLEILAGKILSDLQKKEIIKKIEKPKELRRVSSLMYEILPHERLIRERFK